jgi:uncharacterized protein (TIGR02001 family)
MLRPAIPVWLIATACAAHAGEADAPPAATAQPKLTAGALLMTDYIYRGISYSAHQPSVGTYVDAQSGWLYAWTNFNSVKFSTSPAVELTTAAGIRPTLGPFEFDIGAAYYYYPGEIGPERSNYWEAHATVSHKLTEKLTLGATLAYAPNVWQSGAWGTYAAGTVALELPGGILPANVGWTLSADLGRSLFGRTSPTGGGVNADGGGLPLPAYTNWRAGVTFSYNPFKLSLNYADTNLSRENCYVMTGDLGAIPGGVSNPGNNPTGLRSGLCGATFYGTLGFEFSR